MPDVALFVFVVFVVLVVVFGYVRCNTATTAGPGSLHDTHAASSGVDTRTEEETGPRIRCHLTTGCDDPDTGCVHVSRDVVVTHVRDGGALRANESTDEGYCLPYESRPRRAITCDPRYGELLTVVTPSGRLRATCRCFWPSLFDQSDVRSDCTIARACRAGTGLLVHSTTRVPLHEFPPDLVTDIREFECDTCGDGHCFRPGRDPHTGLPSCVPKPVVERTNGLCLYEGLAGDEVAAAEDATATTTSSPVLLIGGAFVSVDFAKSFANAHTDTVYVPNPCAFDAISGERIGGHSCRLSLSPSGAGYCEPLAENVSTLVYEDDYLPNNGGRYANACYRFTDSVDNVTAYVVEYFVRPVGNDRRPWQDGARRPTLPVVSAELDVAELDPAVFRAFNLNATAEPKRQKILVTQSAVPEDVASLPVPFDKATMSRFADERNDFVYHVPAEKLHLLKYWAPVQRLPIPDCDRVNEERDVKGLTGETIADGEYEMRRQQHVVACREPRYDKRLPVVPNLDVNPLGPAYNADPTSAILRFDKSALLVTPYWYRSYFTNEREVRAYVSRLPSRPPPG